MNTELINKESGKKWYQQPLGVGVLLWLFFPVGLYFMSKEKVWSSKTRIVITSIFSIIIILVAAGENNTNTSATEDNIKSEVSPFGDIVGSYSGTSQMGYSNGTASIEIHSDGSADLGIIVILCC